MLRTKNIITRFEELDELWAFEYYLRPFGLKEKLEGQTVNMHSPFKKEETPSFFLFNEGRYFFKCFATDLGGDVYEMVKFIFKFSNKADAINKVWTDYEKFLNGTQTTWSLNDYSNVQYTKKIRFHVKNVEMRKWNALDANYWKKYHITSKLLEEHNVSALEKIVMNKIENDTVSDYTIETALAYGFFKSNGELYKIYQPGRKKGKYLRVRDHIQGIDQINEKNSNLLITKALKDVIGFKTLNIPDWNVIAPNSENEVFSDEIMLPYKNKYKNIRTLFDNDSAGETAKSLYKERHGILTLDFNMGHKDLTDTIEHVDFTDVKLKMQQLLN